MRSGTHRLIADTLDKANDHGIEVKWHKGRYINNDGERISGYFDGQTLAVARGKAEVHWARVLLHEGCHMYQWAENSKYWTIVKDHDYDLLYRYCAGRPVYERALKTAFNRIIRLEADCERRAWRKSRKYDLPFTPDRYAQVANTYLFLYTVLFECGKWPPRSPSEDSRVVSRMPTKLWNPEDYMIGKLEFDHSIFDVAY